MRTESTGKNPLFHEQIIDEGVARQSSCFWPIGWFSWHFPAISVGTDAHTMTVALLVELLEHGGPLVDRLEAVEAEQQC